VSLPATNPGWWATIPALLLGEGYSPAEQEVVTLVENLHRNDLSATARKVAIARLGVLMLELGTTKVQTKAETGAQGGKKGGGSNRKVAAPQKTDAAPAEQATDKLSVACSAPQQDTLEDQVANTASVTTRTVRRANAEVLSAAKRAGEDVGPKETLPQIASVDPARAHQIVAAGAQQLSTEAAEKPKRTRKKPKQAVLTASAPATALLAVIDATDVTLAEVLSEVARLRPTFITLLRQWCENNPA
jgi:hypothetical protein